MRAAIALALLIGAVLVAQARDDGRYANEPLHKWFDQLASGKGLCCSFADGRRIDDAEWGSENGHYWVMIDGQKISVPEAALINEPNKAGPAYAWPYLDQEGNIQIRCFLKGLES